MFRLANVLSTDTHRTGQGLCSDDYKARAMNTARSTLFGWGALIAGAGVSFYFAKRGVDARRREQAASGERPAEIKDWRQRIQQPSPQRPNADHSNQYTKSESPQEGFQAALKKKD